MAFRHSTYHAPQRIYTTPPEPQIQTQSQVPERVAQAEQEEWVLFSPVAQSSTDRTCTATSVRTQTQTAGRSRISDFGSLDTAARSYGYDLEEGEEDAVEDEETEDGELDSLDSHLHEFRSEPSVYRKDGAVLPTHDGLGSFRLEKEGGMGEDVQEHLYAFERYNPRKVKRRRESLELGQLELESERAQEQERIRRIEKWRMEHSRVLVEEIQKETRRRKESMSTERRAVLRDQEQEDIATLSTVGTNEDVDAENESFWNRITRTVIRDLMGIDDHLLSIIFGENLPEDDDLSTTPPANGLIPASQYDQSSWEYRLLDRISRELGILANQISDHPGAFNTYLRSQQIPLPYAGLPVIPETPREQVPPAQPIQQSTSTIESPAFLPTIQQPTTTQPLPIPQTHHQSTTFSTTPTENTPRPSHILTREEWEADLDIKLVFRYLRDRFTSKFARFQTPSSQASATAIHLSTQGTAHLATASTATTASAAERVRMHHPLVNPGMGRDREREKRVKSFRVSVPGEGEVSGMRIGLGKRRQSGSSSCATSERVKSRNGSSRHYWDFGGSVGSGGGSMIASGAGGMGSWGEV